MIQGDGTLELVSIDTDISKCLWEKGLSQAKYVQKKRMLDKWGSKGRISLSGFMGFRSDS